MTEISQAIDRNYSLLFNDFTQLRIVNATVQNMTIRQDTQKK